MRPSPFDRSEREPEGKAIPPTATLPSRAHLPPRAPTAPANGMISITEAARAPLERAARFPAPHGRLIPQWKILHEAPAALTATGTARPGHHQRNATASGQRRRRAAAAVRWD